MFLVCRRTACFFRKTGPTCRKKNRFRGSFTLLFNIHNLPLIGLAPAAQSSPLSFRARTSFLLNCQGQPRKKNRFRGSFTLLFNIHNLPPGQGLRLRRKALRFRSEHERHFSPIVRGSHEKREVKTSLSRGCGLSAEPELFTSSNVRVCASRVPLKLSTILSS